MSGLSVFYGGILNMTLINAQSFICLYCICEEQIIFSATRVSQVTEILTLGAPALVEF